MTDPKDDRLLRWVVDAVDAEERASIVAPADVRRLRERLLDAVEPVQPSVGARRRLADSLSGVQRLLPFLDEASALFELEPEAMMTVFARADDAQRWTETGVPGVSFAHFDAGPSFAHADTGLVRFTPGASFPPHRHHGRELTYVLHGRVHFSDGVSLGPGDRRWIEGGVHAVEAGEEGTLYLTFHEGITVLSGS